MAIKKLPLFFFLFVFLLSTTLCLGYERDPQRELEECRQQCQQQAKSREEQRECDQRCQKRYDEQQKRQEEDKGSRGNQQEDQRVELEKCRRQCQQQAQSREEQRECEQRCQKRYEEQLKRQEEEKGSEGDPREDPRVELEKCQRQCQQQAQSREEQRECEQRCQKRYDEQQKRQEEEKGGRGDPQEVPRIELDKCRRQCQQQAQSREEQRECEQRCQQKYEETQEGRGSRQEEERDNPYYFRSQSFQTKQDQEGQVHFLPKFTEKSDLLRHIERYRLEVCEANPHAFVIPHHSDTETIFFVVRGRGTLTEVKQNKRESYNIERGDVMKVDAGTTIYVTNHDNNERLRVVKLAQSQNVPGDSQKYFGAGGENPETFYKAFSDEVLEAAFNTPSDRLQRLFGQQIQGAVVKATAEQVKALTKHAQSSKGGKSKGKGPFNLLQSRPVHSNKFGQFFEVTPNDCKDLQDLDSSVSFAKINQGGMMAPFFNSKSTKIAYVVEGNGRFEIACPHVASQSQGSQTREGVTESTNYKRLSAHLSRGDALVIPAGHPVIFIAGERQNLQLACFGVNAQNNERHFLAGQENVMNQLEKEAKELSFNTRAEEVEEIFKNQKDSYFVAGPKEFEEREEKGGKGQRLASILEFAGF